MLTETRMSKLANLSAERASSVVSTLLLFRLIDVALALSIGFGTAGQPHRLPIPAPAKMVDTNSLHKNAPDDIPSVLQERNPLANHGSKRIRVDQDM